MKKITIIASVVALCSSAFAQRISNVPRYSFGEQTLITKAQLPQQSANNKTGGHSNARTTGTPFYTQDFGAGMPAGWVTAANGAPINWRITHNPKSSAFNRPTFKSTSVSNGYLIFPYDSFANKNGNPVPYPKYKASITTSSINCSAHPTAVLKFQHYFEALNAGTPGLDQLRLSVSADGGVTFVDYPIMHSIQANVVSTDPLTESINISDIAGGKSNVMIKFTYDGDYYWWAIDDITLEEVTIQDEKIEQYYYLDKGYSGTYKAIPKSQMPDSMYLQGAIFNAGYKNQMVQLKGSILSSTKTVLATKTATGKTLKALTGGVTQAQARDTQYVALSSTKNIGSYYAVITTVQDTDANLANNTDTLSFAVTDTIYARDNSIISSQVGTHSYTKTAGAEQGFEVLNLFELNQKAVASSISLYLMPKDTKIGSKFSLRIYADADTVTLNHQYQPLVESKVDTIAAPDTGKWITYMLPGNAVLDKGAYWAGIMCQQNGDSITLASDVKTIHNLKSASTIIRATVSDKIFGYAGAPFIRLNMSKFGVGIADNKTNNTFKLYQNQPNPFNGVSTIKYSLNTPSKVTMEVHDITGKKLMELNEGNKSAGDYTISIDGNKLGKGVYFYTLRAGDYQETLRMVIAE